MKRTLQILSLLFVTCFSSVFFACAQNRVNDSFDDRDFLGPISFGHAGSAFLLDAYGDGEDDVMFLGYSVIEKNTRFDDRQLRRILLKGLSPEVKCDAVVSFSSLMPDVAVVFEGRGEEVNVLFDFSHNLLQLNTDGRDILYDITENRREYLDVVIQLFPNDGFLRQYASR